MKRRRSAWTREELHTLEIEWHEVAARTLHSKLKRHTWLSVTNKAYEMGLPFGIPQGFESAPVAEKRTGYCQKTLWRIIEREGVRVYHQYMRHSTRQSCRRYFDPYEIDEAIARYMRAETIIEAAKRLRSSVNTVRAVVRALGYTTTRGVDLLLAPEVYDTAMNEWRAGEHKRRSEGIRRALRKRYAAARSNVLKRAA